MKIETGDVISVEYTLLFKDRRIFDSNAGKEPLNFKVGEGQLLPGLEEAVIGMEIGQRKRLDIPCEKAFGPRRNDLITQLPIADLPEHITPKVGQLIDITNHDGPRALVMVTEMTATHITIDANPPQAGQDFVLAIEILDIHDVSED